MTDRIVAQARIGVSYTDAKLNRLKRYFTGQPCKYGHVDERNASDGRCCECARIKTRSAYNADPAAGARKAKEWRAANPEKDRAIRGKADAKPQRKAKQQISIRKWRDANAEHVAEYVTNYYRKNAKSISAAMSVYNKANRAAGTARTQRYKARKLNATPVWADPIAIREIYRNCPTGHHVDHIVPLKGKTVCGLHVPANLQYLPASVNLAKNNRHWPDMP